MQAISTGLIFYDLKIIYIAFYKQYGYDGEAKLAMNLQHFWKINGFEESTRIQQDNRHFIFPF